MLRALRALKQLEQGCLPPRTRTPPRAAPAAAHLPGAAGAPATSEAVGRSGYRCVECLRDHTGWSSCGQETSGLLTAADSRHEGADLSTARTAVFGKQGTGKSTTVSLLATRGRSAVSQPRPTSPVGWTPQLREVFSCAPRACRWADFRQSGVPACRQRIGLLPPRLNGPSVYRSVALGRVRAPALLRLGARLPVDGALVPRAGHVPRQRLQVVRHRLDADGAGPR